MVRLRQILFWNLCDWSWNRTTAGPHQRRPQKRNAKDEVMIEEKTKVTLHSKAWWADLLDDFAELTDPASSDLFL